MEGERLTFTFDAQDPMRLDHFLVSQLPDLSRTNIQRLIKDGFVTVEQSVVQKAGFKLDRKLSILVTLPPVAESKLVPEAIPLDILFEDHNLIAINKPSGMVVHPSAGHSTGTLVHAILAHAPDIEGIGGVKRPGIVHWLTPTHQRRLDG